MNGSGKHPDATIDHNNRCVGPQARQLSIEKPDWVSSVTDSECTLAGEEERLPLPPLPFLLLTDTAWMDLSAARKYRWQRQRIPSPSHGMFPLKRTTGWAWG